MDFKSFWCQGGGHLFAPLHKHHRVLAGVFKFFVQSQRLQLVQQTPDGVLPRRIG